MRLNNLSIRLAELGMGADALPPIEEAVSIYRELAAVDPDAHRPELASALNNLSIRLAELGMGADALPPIEEAVSIYPGTRGR